MLPYQITSAIIGLLIAGTIIWLVRRDHLHGKYALWWLLIAAAFATLGLFPRLVDAVALSLGISYPPILIVLLGIGFLVLKMVTMDIERSKGQIRLHRLAQRLAILEAELESERSSKSKDSNESDD